MESKSYIKGAIIVGILFFIMVIIIKNIPEDTNKKKNVTEIYEGIINCTIYNFEEVVLKPKDEQILVLFSRDADPYRDKMREIIQKVAKEKGSIKLAEVNTESVDTGNITSTYGVMLVPAVAYFKNGKCIFVYEGSGLTELDVKNMLDMK